MPLKQDYVRLSREVIVALRGKESQVGLSQRLGYRYNKVAKWEAGSHGVHWADFVAVCTAQALDLNASLTNHANYYGRFDRAKYLLGELIDDLEAKKIAALVGASPSSISRWLQGSVDTPLPVIFAILDMHERLYPVIASLLDLRSVPTMRRLHALRSSALLLWRDFPEAPLVLCAIDLKEYKNKRAHRPGFFARRLGFSLTRERQILAALQKAGMLTKDGDRYHASVSFTNVPWNSRETFRINQANKAYWLRRGITAYEHNSFQAPSILGGYEVFSAPSGVVEQIKHEVAACMRRVHRLLEEAPPNEGDGLHVFQYQVMNV